MPKTTKTKRTKTVPPPAQPAETYRGCPVYTGGQDQAAGRRLTPGQKVRAYLRYWTQYDGHMMIDLYHLDDTRATRPLSPRQQAQKTARRTCVLCSTVAPDPLPEYDARRRAWLTVSGRVCPRCEHAARDRHARTCQRCGSEFQDRASVHYDTCDACIAVRDQGQELAYRLTRRHCPDCCTQTATREEIEAADAADSFGRAFGYPRTCEPCQDERRRQAEEAERRAERDRWDELGPVRQWARGIMAAPHLYAIVDTETTGLDLSAKIVEISVTDGAGTVLLDTLVNPGVPIPEDAQAIHGISDDDVHQAPDFWTVLPRLTEALRGRRIVIYNRDYDSRVLAYELNRYHRTHTPTLPGIPLPEYEQHPAAVEWMNAQHWDQCAMLAYAVHVGDWSDYWGGWKWQRLGGGHRALGDCRTVVERIREIAERPDPV
ncbi:3'-5' exonuclease [Streptomyces sp. NPDC001108]